MRQRPGQTLVEFAFVIPVFLLFVFGIIQVALLYKVNSALGQAASDAAHVLAAQSSSGPLTSNGDTDVTYTADWQADAEVLTYSRAALASQNLANIQEIDIYPAVPDAGDPNMPTSQVQQNFPVANSVDLPAGNPAQTIAKLENVYALTPPPGPTPVCKIGPFYLQDPLPSPFKAGDGSGCALPWNGVQYSNKTNQNGRTDQRCGESSAYVRIVYQYRPFFFPLIPAITLVAHDVVPLEPRQYIVDATTQQAIECSQFPAFHSGTGS